MISKGLTSWRVQMYDGPMSRPTGTGEKWIAFSLFSVHCIFLVSSFSYFIDSAHIGIENNVKMSQASLVLRHRPKRRDYRVSTKNIFISFCA